MKTVLVILITIFFTSSFCTSKKDTGNKPKDQLVSGGLNNKQIKETDQTTKPQTSNDNSFLVLRTKYPNAIDIDTIRRLFTYTFQELLKKSSNLAFIQIGRIIDIEEYKGNHIITIERRNVIGRFSINSQLWQKFVTDISSLQKLPRRGNFVVKITSIIPIHSETNINIDDFSIPIDNETVSERDNIDISGSDIQDNVHLSFEVTSRPYYIFNGVLIEYSIL